jgi:hypothetical protein
LTPTQRTVACLRRHGYLAATVERYIHEVRRHRDLFGVADVMAAHPRDRLVLLVQATSLAHVPDRLRRVQSRPETALLLRAGIGVEVWGWYTRDGHWFAKRVALRSEDLSSVVLSAPRARRQRKGERQRELFG